MSKYKPESAPNLGLCSRPAANALTCIHLGNSQQEWINQSEQRMVMQACKVAMFTAVVRTDCCAGADLDLQVTLHRQYAWGCTQKLYTNGMHRAHI